MPQPYHGYFIGSQEDLLALRPDHLAHIGAIVARWSAVETSIRNLFAVVLSAWAGLPVTGEIVGQYIGAGSILGEIKALSGRLSLISNVLRQTAPTELAAEFRDKIGPKLRKAAGKRDRVAHGDWHVPGDGKPFIVLVSEGGTNQSYELKDFKETLEDMRATHRQLDDFFERLKTAWRTGQKPSCS